MLEVTYGQTKNQVVANKLTKVIQSMSLEGSLYIGYPILATADEPVTVDALLVSMQHGLIAFLFDDESTDRETSTGVWNERVDRQDQLFIAVENYLRRHESLRSGRRLGIEVQTVMVVPDISDLPNSIEGEFTDVDGIPDVIRKFSSLDHRHLRPLQAALQRVATIKPIKRRTGVKSTQSKGAVLKKIEREIANLDQWQKRAAIESPEGPQRIRGLAGSGKTIVLALKAAYLHANNPDWNIAVTFWSRSLYQQFEDLVRRFSFEQLNDEPNWQKLHILHAWGGQSRSGLYQQIASRNGLAIHNFLYGKSKYGMDRAFEGVCSELLSGIGSSEPEPMYDAVLIDEAQDLPIPFFRLVYKVTSYPKRIIWAYDELQNLSESVLPTIEQQFGLDSHGNALVKLTHPTSAPDQDIVLPICYRNTPWAISLAHALGLGTAREEGMVQSFDDPSLWTHIGYTVIDGDLEKGSKVTLRRGEDSYPGYFSDLLAPDDAISSHVFQNEAEQASWIAQDIRQNLIDDELEHDDILIVLPDTYKARGQAAHILRELNNLGIDGHISGVTTSQDEVFQQDSIAMANIYRSKGNEAPMVYVVNAQYCVSQRQLATVRNILFTAITRSKSWVRICGWGRRMQILQEEIQAIQHNNYDLSFQIPTDGELENMRQIHRDITADERSRMNQAKEGLRDFFEALDRGEITLDDLSMQDRTSIAKYFGSFSSDSR